MDTPFRITAYQRQDRQATKELIYNAYRLHSHLDWQDIDDWINDEQGSVLLAWAGNTLVGMLATAMPLSQVTWLRLVAFEDNSEPAQLMEWLWPPLQEQLRAQGVHEVGALVVRHWIEPFIQQVGFAYREDIITLRRHGHDYPAPLRTDISVRIASLEDLPHVVAVDNTAFSPLWQMSATALRQAARLAASFTVAELDGRIVGYQLSTHHHEGAHLARLAVLPEWQGHGIGGLLIGDMFEKFARRRIFTISVNTQQTNHQSQRLYKQYGFVPSGPDMPFWSKRLSET